MTTYLVECYWPGVNESRFDLATERLATEWGGSVTWIDSILIPEDEIVLCLVAAGSPEAVRESASRAGMPAERVVSCLRASHCRNGGTSEANRDDNERTEGGEP